MNILELYNSRCTNIGLVIDKLGSIVIRKHMKNNISLVSYDAYIITLDFINKFYYDNLQFFEEIKKQEKPIIIVYDSINNPDGIGFDILSEKYKIKFEITDCSVIEKNGLNYTPDTKYYDEAMSMTSKIMTGYCGVKGTNKYYILSYKNIFVMNDIHKSFVGKELIGLQKMDSLVKMLLNPPKKEITKNIDWISQVKILDDKELDSKLNVVKDELEKLELKKSELEDKLSKNNHYKSILYTSGDQLVNTVKEILEEMLNISIDDTDEKRQDLFFKLNKINVLVEVKGVNHTIKRENVSQAKRHVEDYAAKNEIFGADVEKKCKGVLIMNVYSLHTLEDKMSKDIYSKDVIADIKHDNICTFDTLTFLSLYSKWKTNPQSIDIKKILLNTNYNEPDFMDIINIQSNKENED